MPWRLDPNGHDGGETARERAEGAKCLTGENHVRVQVEYDARGHMARCEVAPGSPAAAAPCVCHALAGHTGEPGARWHFQLSPPAPGKSRSKDGLEVYAFASQTMVPDAPSGYYKPMTTDPAIADWAPPDRDVLAACFAGAPSGPEIDARATIDFDRGGTATKAVVVATTGSLTAAQQGCLRAAFLRVRVPCPTTPAASASAELKVKFEPVIAPVRP